MVRTIPATQSLSELGYEQLYDRIYKATWSTSDVEHFFYLAGGPRGLSAAFGIRNLCVEVFAVREMIKYGGDIFGRALQFDERSSCTMRYDFSVFDPFWSRPIRSLFDPTLGPKIRQMMTEHVLPVIKDVTTTDKLLRLLVADDMPCRWAFINGAIRAAQIVALADKCGMPVAQSAALFEARMRWIGNGFMKDSPTRGVPAEYIRRVVEDWKEHSGVGP